MTLHACMHKCEADVVRARALFGQGYPKITTDQRLLGGHIGTCHGRREFVGHISLLFHMMFALTAALLSGNLRSLFVCVLV